MQKKKVSSYREFVKSFSSEDFKSITQIKRLLETISCDSKFRELVENSPDDPTINERMRAVGVDIKCEDVSGFWSKKHGHLYTKLLRGTSENVEQYPEIKKELDRFPLMKLWFNWSRQRGDMLDSTIDARVDEASNNVDSSTTKGKYELWRNRRIVAAKSELGHFGNQIDHPTFAFELSRGCSVNCWFCGFDAKKLNGVYEYNEENQQTWRNIVAAGAELFGKNARNALCYYATEPMDNPSYLDFIKDYQNQTGGYVCTATAAPFKDPDAFRNLLNYYSEAVIPWPRVSVLTVSMMRKLHETYTPMELRDASLLDQTRDSGREKAVSGKTLEMDRDDLGGERENEDGLELLPQGSIACVSGFYVNMIDKTIQLVSPCRANEKYPYGYRVFGTESFTNAFDYKEAILTLVDRCMNPVISPDMKISFRDDLEMIPTDSGFTLRSFYQKHYIKGGAELTELGKIIYNSKPTYDELFQKLMGYGASPLTIPGMVKNLFDKGFLDETVF